MRLLSLVPFCPRHIFICSFASSELYGLSQVQFLLLSLTHSLLTIAPNLAAHDFNSLLDPHIHANASPNPLLDLLLLTYPFCRPLQNQWGTTWWQGCQMLFYSLLSPSRDSYSTCKYVTTIINLCSIGLSLGCCPPLTVPLRCINLVGIEKSPKVLHIIQRMRDVKKRSSVFPVSPSISKIGA